MLKGDWYRRTTARPRAVRDRGDKCYRICAEGIRDKALEDREVTLQARNNASLDQFANGKIKQVIPRAIWEMRSAHESMTNQVMADSETMKRFAEVITRMVYEAVNEGA